MKKEYLVYKPLEEDEDATGLIMNYFRNMMYNTPFALMKKVLVYG